MGEVKYIPKDRLEALRMRLAAGRQTLDKWHVLELVDALLAEAQEMPGLVDEPVHHPDCASLHGFTFCNCVVKDFKRKPAPPADGKPRRWRYECDRCSMRHEAKSEYKVFGTCKHCHTGLMINIGPVEEVTDGKE